MTATTLTQAENDDLTTANDFRQVGIVVDRQHGSTTVATDATARQTFIVKMSSQVELLKWMKKYHRHQLVQ